MRKLMNLSPDDEEDFSPKNIYEKLDKWFDEFKEGWTFRYYKTKQNVRVWWITFRRRF